MAYDEGLAERLESFIPQDSGQTLTTTYMFGGLGYLLQGNFCIGIWKDCLILRVGIEVAQSLLTQPNIKPFDITGKSMKGWAMVNPEALTEDEDLQNDIQLCFDFVQTLPKK
ncbi:TfoX/Sxy family protein [bacterium AH-315-I18]|nr:TfoX/Sxy family protein [Phycisphaeraceae bacterium]MBN4061181.1 TfoX/Sxy family protein [bacterium AH-315-I18]